VAVGQLSCSVLQRVAVWCNMFQCVAVCCSVLQRVAEEFNELKTSLYTSERLLFWHCGVAVRCSGFGMLQWVRYVAAYCSVLPCVAVCCSVLQCEAVCCSVQKPICVHGRAPVLRQYDIKETCHVTCVNTRIRHVTRVNTRT